VRTVLAVCVFLGIVVSGSFAQAKKAVEPELKSVVRIDTALIRELRADDYGMKKYVMAFLKAGPKRDQDSVTAANLQGEHMKNIQRMANLGKLVLAGPFLDGNEFQGIYIFNVESVEEAKELTESDPAIKAGRLVMELHPWYGSAALQKVNELHRRIQSKSF
jgi:uncharacterized protein YciI